MKTPAIFGIVVMAHCLAIGGIIMMQGCDTTRPSAPQEIVEEVIMPPARLDPVAEKPVIKPAKRVWPSQTTEYIVKPGDSISKIAKRYGVSSSSIISLNGIANKNVIRVGQRLMLPGSLDVSKPVKSVKSSSALGVKKSVKAAGGTYIVKPGDCLGVIASQHGVKTAAIMQANGLAGDKIVVGQKLVIPGVKIASVKKPPASKPAAPKPAVKKPAAPKPAAKPAASPVPAVAEPVSPAADASAPAPQKKAVITETHVVQQGEGLRDISMQWLVSEEKIRDFNNLAGEALQPGKVLLIPLSE